VFNVLEIITQGVPFITSPSTAAITECRGGRGHPLRLGYRAQGHNKRDSCIIHYVV